MKLKLILIILCLGTLIFPQKYQYQNSFGKFISASSFYINSTGFIYVTDTNTDEVYALDTLGNLKLKIGGFGYRESAFDDPVDVFADALKLYISDKNNNRIQRLDKNMNFNFQIYTRESDNEAERFGYPLSAVMSNQGDVFILDSENSRIVQFDIFGNFIRNFGGYDYGNFALQNPKQLAVSMTNNIFVIDGNEILIFDQYGNSITKVSGPEDFISIRIIFNWMTLSTDKKIYIANLRIPEISLKEVLLEDLPLDTKIVSSLIFNDKLYLLTKKEILVFNRI
jgi:DNA-binding beta-propeller fold protein YncE